jgi:protein-tyrosine phosphatase
MYGGERSMYDMSGNFNNQPMYNQPMPGYNYMGMQQPVAKVMNNLSAEEIKSLQQTQEEFRLNLRQWIHLQYSLHHLLTFLDPFP